METQFPLLFKRPLLLCKWSDELYALLHGFFVTHCTWLIESLSRDVSWRSEGLLQVREWVQSRACACLSVRTCERYEVLHVWKRDFMKIAANIYNRNTFTVVRNKSFHIRVVWSIDSQSEGREPLEACETVCFLIVRYKEKLLLYIIF